MIDGDEEAPKAVDVERAASKFVTGLKGWGRPSGRQNWKVLLAHLIILPDPVIIEIARQGRIQGVEWIVPVAEGMLEELRAGRAFRDTDGAITLRERPRARGLIDLL